MPELDKPYGYPVLITLTVGICVGLFVWLLLGVFREDAPAAGTLPAEPGVPPARG